VEEEGSQRQRKNSSGAQGEVFEWFFFRDDKLSVAVLN
jgi:hypothetical protein